MVVQNRPVRVLTGLQVCQGTKEEVTQMLSGRVRTSLGMILIAGLSPLGALPLAAQSVRATATGGIQYVSPKGSDSNNGLSWAAAKVTIQAAIDALPRQANYGGHGKIHLAAGVYEISSTLILPAGTVLEGLAGGSSPSIIRPSSSFPKNSTLIAYGNGGAPEGIFLKDLVVDCRNISGATGVENAYAQDNSGLENVSLWNCPRFGLHIAGSPYGGGQGSLYRDVQVLYNASCTNCTASTVPVQLDAPPRYIEGLIIDARDARVHPKIGLMATKVSTTILSAHCEGVATCFEVSSGSILRSVDCGSSVAAGAVTTCVDIPKGSGLAVFGLDAGGNVTNLLTDVGRKITIPSSVHFLPLYAVGAGSIGQQNIISTYNGISLKASSFQTNAGQPVMLSGPNGTSAGTIALSSGSGSHAFRTAYRSIPSCTANDTSRAVPVRVRSTRTAVSVSGTGDDIVAWICTSASN